MSKGKPAAGPKVTLQTTASPAKPVCVFVPTCFKPIRDLRRCGIDLTIANALVYLRAVREAEPCGKGPCRCIGRRKGRDPRGRGSTGKGCSTG